MAVVAVDVGPKRVHLTAYCPDDALGLLACDFVLGKVKELLNGTTEADLRAWLVQHQPDTAELFEAMDAGWTLPVNDDLSVDPSNAHVEMQIVKHLLRERHLQRRG